MPTKEKVLRLAGFVQKWMQGLLTEEEYFELNAWYSALEDEQLGYPDGVAVERMEKRINEMLMNTYEPKSLPYGVDIGKLLRGER